MSSGPRGITLSRSPGPQDRTWSQDVLHPGHRPRTVDHLVSHLHVETGSYLSRNAHGHRFTHWLSPQPGCLNSSTSQWRAKVRGLRSDPGEGPVPSVSPKHPLPSSGWAGHWLRPHRLCSGLASPSSATSSLVLF